MTDEQSNKPRMTCGTWLAIGTFLILGLFGLVLHNSASRGANNRQERVQRFFNHLEQDSIDDAFDMLAADWQTRIETASALQESFKDVTVSNIHFDLDTNHCYTNISGNRLTSQSVGYQYWVGTADVNNIETDIDVRIISQRGESKILGMYLGDIDYGPHIPNNCFTLDS